MRTSEYLIVFLIVFALCTSAIKSNGINGGDSCLKCVLLVALVEQLAEINNATISHTSQILCTYLPAPLRHACDEAFEYLLPMLIELIEQKAGPDVVCHALKFCWTDPGQKTCSSLIPEFQLKRGLDFKTHVWKAQQSISHLLSQRHIPIRFCELPGIKVICLWAEMFVNSHEPLIDMDHDGFSAFKSMRGSNWRGRDCSDANPDIHPGALPKNGDMKFDSNCNGIYGVNNQTNRTYEDELCGLSQGKGVAVIGDSVAAHFHLPVQWIDATQISHKAFTHLSMILANELDWPMMSTITGYGTNNWTEVITGFIDSFYLRLRNRNHCNHRDYQNIGINGESSSSAKHHAHLLSRTAHGDKPVIVFSILVGNDVCNHHPDTFAHMTTPAEFYNNTLETLDTLSQKLPKGSHVFLMGLADGTVLFDSLATRIHPVGAHWGKFTYAKFYDFLNCLQISPCRGWMNSNQTMRDLTTKKANELSSVLQEIVKQRKDSYPNFKLYYMENPFNEVIDLWKQQGREVWELIDASDGFHPSQNAMAFSSPVIWKNIQTNYPDVLGPVNLHNGLIEELFGDQGGY